MLARQVAASAGRTRLSIDANVLAEQSVPQVAHYGAAGREAIWTCSSSPLDIETVPGDGGSNTTVNGVTVSQDGPLPGDADCGGFAVVSTPIHEPFNAMSLILIGVVVSIWIEVAYQEARSGAREKPD